VRRRWRACAAEHRRRALARLLGCYRLRFLVQNEGQGLAKLTEPWISSKEAARALTSRSGGEVDLAHAEEAVAGVGVGEVSPEEAPGAEAELMRSLDGALVRRSG